MTREEMIKRHWKPYMVVAYQDNGMQSPIECMLSAIDFDAEVLTLTPMEPIYVQREFSANLKFCSIPKRMKAISVNGKKIIEPTENFIKARKYP